MVEALNSVKDLPGRDGREEGQLTFETQDMRRYERTSGKLHGGEYALSLDCAIGGKVGEEVKLDSVKGGRLFSKVDKECQRSSVGRASVS